MSNLSICPKGKVSKARRDKRRAQNWKISMPNLVKCNKCGAFTMQHVVCRECGNYNKRNVINLEKNN